MHIHQTGLHPRLVRYRVVRAVCVSVLFVALWSTQGWGFRHLTEGQPAPDFTLKDLDGKPHALSQKKGNVAVVLYWRVEQQRSLNALAQLKKLSEELSGQPVCIMAITKETDKLSQIKEIRTSLELPFPILIDDSAQVYSEFGVFVFPSTALIDKNGIYRFHYAGFRDDYQAELSGQIRMLLGLLTKEELEQERQQHQATLTDAQRKAIHHINLGKQLRERLMDEKALQEFEQAVQLDPNNAQAHVLLGLSLLEQEHADRAIESFKKALTLDPRSSDAKMGLGSAYRRQGKIDQALEILEDGINLCPDAADFHLELGKTYESLGKTDKALEHYKAAAECCLKTTKRPY